MVYDSYKFMHNIISGEAWVIGVRADCIFASPKVVRCLMPP